MSMDSRPHRRQMAFILEDKELNQKYYNIKIHYQGFIIISNEVGSGF